MGDGDATETLYGDAGGVNASGALSSESGRSSGPVFCPGGKPHICFKKELGVGFADYVSALRLERAKELLRDGKVKIKDIHSQVGFTSAHYFGTWFKKNTGVTPSEFRKQ